MPSMFAWQRIIPLALFAAMLLSPSGSSLLASRLHAQQVEAPKKVTWSMLRKFNYRTGDISEDLKALDKQMVRVPGFIVPLEDSATEATEFLLVPYQGACIHVPPPPPNQIVHVVMAKAKKVKFTMWDPYWIEGRLKIETVESPYGEVSFSLEGLKQEDYVD